MDWHGIEMGYPMKHDGIPVDLFREGGIYTLI